MYGPLTRSNCRVTTCAHAGSSTRYCGVVRPQRSSCTWLARRTVNGVTFKLGFHRSEEDAAHVWDLSAICLGLGTAKLNFPASEYESGRRWAEEAHEARRVDIKEFVSIWSKRERQRERQRALDGVLIVPGRVVALFGHVQRHMGLQAHWLASRLDVASLMGRHSSAVILASDCRPRRVPGAQNCALRADKNGNRLCSSPT
jgi:hypothetical protein